MSTSTGEENRSIIARNLKTIESNGRVLEILSEEVPSSS